MNRQAQPRILAAGMLAALLLAGAANAAVPQSQDAGHDRPRNAHARAPHERPQAHRGAERGVRPDPQLLQQPQQAQAEPMPRKQPRFQLQDLHREAPAQARRDQRDAHRPEVGRPDAQWSRAQRPLAQWSHAQRPGVRQPDERRQDSRRLDSHRRVAYARYRHDYDRRTHDIRIVVAPRFYIRPAHYRYYWGGTWYTTSNYGADVLRQAVDWGYREGLRAGRADRFDGWPADYRDSIAWRNGDYGYGGRYISRADYAYYFRQGFQRGYDDGYFGRMQYGRYVDNDVAIAEAVIATILGLQLLR